MKYRDRVTGAYPLTTSEIRGKSDVLFGSEIPEALMDGLGVDEVWGTPQPSYDPNIERIDEGPPANIGGAWRQTWIVTMLPPIVAPNEVTKRQAKLMLSRAGILSRADAATAA